MGCIMRELIAVLQQADLQPVHKRAVGCQSLARAWSLGFTLKDLGQSITGTYTTKRIAKDFILCLDRI